MTFALVVAAAGTLLGVTAVQIRLGSAWAPRAAIAPSLLAGCIALSAAALALSVVGWRWVRPRPHRHRRDLFDDAVTMAGAMILAGANIHLGLGLRDDVAAFSAVASREAALPLIRALPDGTGVVMGSTMALGATARLADVLDATPGARTVYLFGPGGAEQEGADMAALIRSRGLRTVAVGPCASACTIAFAGGIERLVPAGVQVLGYHASSQRDGDRRVRTADGPMAMSYLGHGLSREFVERAEATDPANLWRPTLAELSDAGAVDGTYGPYDMPGLRWLAPVEGRDPLLDGTWIGRFLADSAPRVMADARAWTQEAWGMGRNEARLEDLRQGGLDRAIGTWLATGGDNEVRAAAALVAAAMAQARRFPGSECARIGAGPGFLMAWRLVPGTGRAWGAILGRSAAGRTLGWPEGRGLPVVSDTALWDGAAAPAAPAESCQELMEWYRAAADASDPGGTARLRARFSGKR